MKGTFALMCSVILLSYTSGCMTMESSKTDRKERSSHRFQQGIAWGCADGDVALTRLLLDRGVYLIKRTWDGNTALMAAAVNGHALSFNMLLEKGVDANAANQSGDFALLFAAKKGGADIVNMLLAITCRSK